MITAVGWAKRSVPTVASELSERMVGTALARLCPPYDSSTRPYVEHISILRSEIVDPARTRIGIRAGLFAIDRNQRGLDIRLHLAAVATDIDDRALLDQAPDAVLLRSDLVLHISLRSVGARERGVQFGDAVGGEGLQIIRIEEILFGMA